MPRKSPKSINVNANVRCQKVYPRKGSNRNIRSLKTVGVLLTKEQALHLARVLLAVTQEWDKVDITAYRFDLRKSDSTYRITVTSLQE